ncbi:MAG: hypothetical protein ACRC4N_05945, partial [Gammaproteobacteria bacterium]
STTLGSADQWKSAYSSKYIHTANVPQHTKDSVEDISTTVSTTTTTSKASKVIQGKIPWHRLLGSKQGQQEILKRLRKPYKPSITIKGTTSVRTMTTTAPSRASTTFPTAESMAAPMTAIPPVTQRNRDNSGKLSESKNSNKVLTLFTTASPSYKTAAVSTPMNGYRVSTTTASHITPIPPSLNKKTYTDDTVEFSGSYSGGSGGFVSRSWEIKKPTFHRRRFRGRKPVKKTTTQAPTTKFVTSEITTLMPHTTSGETKPFSIPTTEVLGSAIQTSSHIIHSDNKVWRPTVKPTSFPRTHSISGEHLPKISYFYTTAVPHLTLQSKKQNSNGKINSDERDPLRRGYQTPGGKRQLTTPATADSKMNELQKTTSNERTLSFDPVTVGTAEESNTLISFPSTIDNSNKILNTNDHTTGYDTISSTTYGFKSTTNDITSKPKIVGGHAASFTVGSNSDAYLPCEATGYPKPAISWKRFSSNTGT